MDNLETITFGFQHSIPEIAAWSIGIVLAIIMLRRGGRKPETLLLIGCVLFLLSSLSSLILNTVVHVIQELRISVVSYGLITGLTTGILSLAGLVCLVWAFWLKFWKKEGAA
jgi:hypothetical protein